MKSLAQPSYSAVIDYKSLAIAVLGTGNVGRTLAAGMAEAGHRVTVGGREPSRPDLAEWGSEAGIAVTDLASAAAAAEVVVLATTWGGAENALQLAAGDGDALDGKVLIDATNPLAMTDRLGLATGFDDSGGEQVQRWAPTARVVKAFNTVGFELMVKPTLPEGPGTMFVAGDDAEAKSVAVSLANDLGWETHDCGDLRAARLTEPLALIWIEHALSTGARSHYFRLAATEA